MGFEFDDPTYVLEFEDGRLEGLEVKAKAQTLGNFLDMTALAAMGDNPSSADMVKVGELLAGFAEVLVEWNVQVKGEDVPATLDGLRRLKFQDAFKIITAWIKATAGVSAPLEDGSNAGGPSVVPLPPMAPLSTSQAS